MRAHGRPTCRWRRIADGTSNFLMTGRQSARPRRRSNTSVLRFSKQRQQEDSECNMIFEFKSFSLTTQKSKSPKGKVVSHFAIVDVQMRPPLGGV
jgi:hypothetical protein